MDLVICKITISLSDIASSLPHNGDNFPSNLKKTLLCFLIITITYTYEIAKYVYLQPIL